MVDYEEELDRYLDEIKELSDVCGLIVEKKEE